MIKLCKTSQAQQQDRLTCSHFFLQKQLFNLSQLSAGSRVFSVIAHIRVFIACVSSCLSCHLDTFCWTFFLSEPHTQGLFYYFILVETGSQSVDQASHGLCVWLSELSLPFPCFSLFYVSSQCTCFIFRKSSFLELSDPGDPVPSALYSYCLGISSFPLSLNVSHGFLFLG